MSEKIRKLQKQQETILDNNNELRVGVFEDYFKKFNLLQKRRPFLKKLINRNLLTEWQALEVLEGDIFIICAVFKFGIMNRTLFFLYDIHENTLQNYSSTSFFKNKSTLAKTLESKELSTRKTQDTELNIFNELNEDKLYLNGSTRDLKFDIEFTRIAPPVVVSIPMTKKHTVYTEKDLLVPSGYIEYKNKKYPLSKKNISILDDHRGYYPLSSGYDWITCMGEIKHNDQVKKFGINLTYFYKNLDQVNINENGYWLDQEFHQLPVVTFKRNQSTWTIKDIDGKVNLVFEQRNQYYEKKRLGLKIDYTLAFGTLSGEVTSSKGERIKINQMFSLGEERKTQFLYQKTMSK